MLRQQQVEIEALRLLVAGRRPGQELRREIGRVEDAYSRMPDPLGMANARGAKALLDLADGRLEDALVSL